MKKAGTLFLILFLITFFSTEIKAYDLPGFPSCETPEGKVISEYEDGEHGILGSRVLHSGKDTVWEIDDSRVLQCFCPKAGDGDEGIQTVFWKFGQNLNSSDIENLKSQGWFYIPSGASWGLKADPYVARNYSYTCRNKPGIGGGGEVLGATYVGSGNIKEYLLIAGTAVFSLLAYLKLRPGNNEK